MIVRVRYLEGGALGGWLGPVDRVPMSGISALLQKKTRKLPCSLHHVTGQPLPDVKSTGHLTLDFPASKTVKNKFLFFIRYPVCYFIIAAWTHQEMWPFEIKVEWTQSRKRVREKNDQIIKLITVCVLIAQSCPTLCDPMDCSPPVPWSMGFSRQEYWSV